MQASAIRSACPPLRASACAVHADAAQEAAIALAALPAGRGHLFVVENGAGSEAFCESLAADEGVLDLIVRSGMHDAEVEALARALATNHTLRALNLSVRQPRSIHTADSAADTGGCQRPTVRMEAA